MTRRMEAMRSLRLWLVSGALLASLAMHALDWHVAARPNAALDVDSLGLSAAQVEALLDCCRGGCNDVVVSDAEIVEAEQALRRALLSESATAADVRALGATLIELRGQWMGSCVEAALRVRGVLTAEQRVTLGRCATGDCVLVSRE
ncbi:MAG: hypothetical protein AAF628_10970 [Planctomycetota bacterium]